LKNYLKDERAVELVALAGGDPVVNNLETFRMKKAVIIEQWT